MSKIKTSDAPPLRMVSHGGKHVILPEIPLASTGGKLFFARCGSRKNKPKADCFPLAMRLLSHTRVRILGYASRFEKGLPADLLQASVFTGPDVAYRHPNPSHRSRSADAGTGSAAYRPMYLNRFRISSDAEFFWKVSRNQLWSKYRFVMSP